MAQIPYNLRGRDGGIWQGGKGFVYGALTQRFVRPFCFWKRNW